MRADVDGEYLPEEALAELVKAEESVAIDVVQLASIEWRAAGLRDLEDVCSASTRHRWRVSEVERVARVEQKQLVEPAFDRIAGRVSNALLQPQLEERASSCRLHRRAPFLRLLSLRARCARLGTVMREGCCLVPKLLKELQAQRPTGPFVTE